MSSAAVANAVVKLESDHGMTDPASAQGSVETPPDSPSQYVEENSYDFDPSSFSAVDFINNSSYLNSDIFADVNGMNGRLSNGAPSGEPQCRWTLEMIQCLIEQYRSHEEAFTGKHVFRRPIWMKITEEINRISTFPVSWLQCRQKWANLKRDAKARQKRIQGRNDDGSLPVQLGGGEGELGGIPVTGEDNSSESINWDEVNELASRGGQAGSKPGFSLFSEVERLMKLEEAAGISVPKKQQQPKQLALPAPPTQMQIPTTIPIQPSSSPLVLPSTLYSQSAAAPSLPQPTATQQATVLFNGVRDAATANQQNQKQRINRIAELLGRRKRKPSTSVSTLQRIVNGEAFHNTAEEKRPSHVPMYSSTTQSPTNHSEDSSTLGVLQQIRDEVRASRQQQREFLQALISENSIQAQAQADRDKSLINLLQALVGTVNKVVGAITEDQQ